MADFAIWSVACEEAAGLQAGSFIDVYDENREYANIEALEGSPLAQLVSKWIDNAKLPWQGTSTDLLSELREVSGEAKEQPWPLRTARELSGELRRLSSSLRAIGIMIKSRFLNGRTRWVISSLEEYHERL
jgi:hypothetical protein